jgi:hypothetical protein
MTCMIISAPHPTALAAEKVYSKPSTTYTSCLIFTATPATPARLATSIFNMPPATKSQIWPAL